MTGQPKQIIWGESVFTRHHEGKARGAYGWTSPKWSCDECGATGYGDQFLPAEWARAHARGHEPCPWCGALCTLRMDGTQRVHTRCPNRPEEVETVWLDAKDQLVTVRSTVAEGTPS